MELTCIQDTRGRENDISMYLLNEYGSVGDGFLGFVKAFFGYPAILIGIFALIGTIAQRKKGSEILLSTLKTIIGFLIISGGAAVLTTTLGNLTSVIKHGFKMGGDGEGLDFIIPSNEAMMAFVQGTLPNVMSTASIILILAMVCNIILAKFSNLKYIYLTGHVAFYMSLAMALGMYMAGLDPMNNVSDTIVSFVSGGVFIGLYMVLSPAASGKLARKIVANERLALGHTGGFGCAVAGIIGTGLLKISRKEQLTSTENIKLPKKLQILTNNMVSLSLTMIIIYMTIMMIALGVSGLEAFAKDGGGSLLGNISDPVSYNVGNAIVFAFIQALTFVSGIQIIMFGVRMFLEELVPAFSGIASKLIKGSKAAVEVQAFWPAAPNGTIIGMISSFSGGLVTFGILSAIHFSTNAETARYFPIVLPELFPHLFIGGTAAVFGNYKGGILGAIIGPFLVGFIWTWFPAIYKDLGFIPSELTDSSLVNGAKSTGSAWAEVDHLVTIIPFLFIKYTNKWVWLGVSIGLFAIPILISQIKNAINRGRGIKQDDTTIDDIKSKQLSKKEKDVVENEHAEMKIPEMD